jgi:undecaprenyl-diphosphatase
VATATAVAVTGLLITDGLLHPIAPFDLPLMQLVQGIDFPGLSTGLAAVAQLTGSTGAIIAWALTLIILASARMWLAALAMFALPVGGVINHVIGEYVVQRTRPDGAEYDIARSLPHINEASFPSGHVMGAVMLYGLLFFVATRLRNRALALTIQTASVAILALVGFARVWEGAHWPSDVLSAYSLGGLILFGIIAVYMKIETAVGNIPFIRAAAVEGPAELRTAHALTSTVFFHEDRVVKVYAPGFVPRAIYWLAFQAEFPYIRNRQALDAAVERRNLAAMLTEYWFGTRRVALATGIEQVNGRPGLASEYIVGHAPSDKASAKAFLTELRGRFEQAGLPTWQIDPRQPRAVDNVLETGAGGYMIVDLESGLVSPLASLKTWRHALRRGMAPIYDDVYFDITRAYVAREASAMQAKLGDEWLADLATQLDRAETAANGWHASEPRIWSRLLTGLWSGFGITTWPARSRARLAGSQEKALGWMADAVDAWQLEGRITLREGDELRAQMATPSFQAVLPHLGAHLVITVFLRFPFGSIARMVWSAWGLGAASVRLLARRIDRHTWKQAWDMHHPIVILLSAIPGFGSFAYLAAKPVRSNRLLVRVTLDAVLYKVPWRLYQRSRTRRLIVRPVMATRHGAPETDTAILLPANTSISRVLPVVAAEQVVPPTTAAYAGWD